MIIEIWFLLSVSVTLFWGLSGVFAKYSTGRLGVARVALLIASVEGVMYSIAFLVLREPHHITLYEGAVATASVTALVVARAKAVTLSLLLFVAASR